MLFRRHLFVSLASVVSLLGSIDFLLFFLALGGLDMFLPAPMGFTLTSMLSSLVSVGDCSSSSMSYIANLENEILIIIRWKICRVTITGCCQSHNQNVTVCHTRWACHRSTQRATVTAHSCPGHTKNFPSHTTPPNTPRLPDNQKFPAGHLAYSPYSC